MRQPVSDVLEGLSPERVGRRVLVIGGAGYAGRRFERALRELGCEVRTFDRVEHGVAGVVGDITDAGAVARACSGIDTVFHTAAAMALWGYARKPERERVFSVNVGGTRNVIEACRSEGVSRLVYVSTTNVVMDPVTGFDGGDESSPYASRFVDLYTPSKIEAERHVLAAHDDERGTVAIRPNGIWGPDGDAYMIKSFLEMVAAGVWLMRVGEPDAQMDNTHVDNLVRGGLLAAAALGERPEVVGGKPYFITDGEAFSAMEWFAPLAASIGVEMPRLRLPSFVLRPLAHLVELGRFVTGGDPTLTRIKATKLCVPNWSSIEAARRDLGYVPIRRRDRLRKDAEHYRSALATIRARR